VFGQTHQVDLPLFLDAATSDRLVDAPVHLYEQVTLEDL